MEEVWKDVVGFEDYFRVSNLGQMFSKRSGRVLKQVLNKSGYKTLSTRIGGRTGQLITFKMHRVVAEAFLEEPSEDVPRDANGIVPVNHRDGNKANNRSDNLQWMTHGENAIHAFDTGLRTTDHQDGEANWNAVLTDDLVRRVRALYVPGRGGFGPTRIAAALGVKEANVDYVLYGGGWSHIA